MYPAAFWRSNPVVYVIFVKRVSEYEAWAAHGLGWAAEKVSNELFSSPPPRGKAKPGRRKCLFFWRNESPTVWIMYLLMSDGSNLAVVKHGGKEFSDREWGEHQFLWTLLFFPQEGHPFLLPFLFFFDLAHLGKSVRVFLFYKPPTGRSGRVLRFWGRFYSVASGLGAVTLYSSFYFEKERKCQKVLCWPSGQFLEKSKFVIYSYYFIIQYCQQVNLISEMEGQGLLGMAEGNGDLVPLDLPSSFSITPLTFIGSSRNSILYPPWKTTFSLGHDLRRIIFYVSDV